MDTLSILLMLGFCSWIKGFQDQITWLRIFLSFKFSVSCFTSSGVLLLSCHSNQRIYDFDNDFLGPLHIRKNKITKKKKKKKMAGKTFHSTTLKTMVRANVDDNSDPDENLFLFVFFNWNSLLSSHYKARSYKKK